MMKIIGMMFGKKLFFTISALYVFFCLIPEAQAQYFGTNKPGYRKFEYKVYQTPHFEIYHYFEDDSVLNYWALAAEEWYRRHSRILYDTFEKRNPLILYKYHADFQQTTAISGQIGVGTGGVTEAFKNRVVMPLAHSTGQTDHVLGHEMVHAFQYDIIINDDTTSLNNLRNLPLWMVEGMAEYMSIGSVDAHTAMWMRDALLQDDFPSLKDLANMNKYFPYRYGQAFWAFVGKVWGDDRIRPLFNLTAKVGYEAAIDSILGISAETFSALWKNAYIAHYSQFLTDSLDRMSGEKLFDTDNAGKRNVAPSISPNGKYIAFFSDRDVVSFDLFLADADEKKIIRKLTTRISKHEIDDLNFMESAGTWSPDNRKLAFTVFAKGVNKLVVVDVRNGKVLLEEAIPGVPAFTYLAWSPDGEKIVLSGLAEGRHDLYAYYPETGAVERLTFDVYSEMQPSWSPDGKYLVYATDRPADPDESRPVLDRYNLAILNVATSRIRVLDVFPGADNLNPVFAPDGRSIFFLSNSDGFRNLFRYYPETGEMYRMTSFMTGISGFTQFSPAISIATNEEKLAYSYYRNNGYQIYNAGVDDFMPVQVSPDSVNFQAATLPPFRRAGIDLVDAGFRYRTSLPDTLIQHFTAKEYKPKFKLDYISNYGGVGMATSRYGTGMSGSIIMMFSDMVGDNQLVANLAVNGEIYDFGAQVAYLNQKHRLNWGGVVSHIPYLSGYVSMVEDSLFIASRETGDTNWVDVLNYRYDYYRTFEDQLALFGYLPLSQTRRFELGASFSWYYYRIDRFNYYYDYYGYPIGVNREKLDAPGGFTLFKSDAAYVEDNSVFGTTSPVRGHRMRLSIEKYFGAVNMFTGLVDYRKYFHLRPLTIALRGYHYGRYQMTEGQDLMYPMYIGYPWLVRGLGSDAFNRSYTASSSNLNINQLTGNKIAVANMEVRIPFTGPERFALIKFKYLPTELSLFMDGGLAWNTGDAPVFRWLPDNPSQRIPVFTAGLSLRVNLLGYMILEPFYAFPLQVQPLKGSFGLNFTPGW